MSTIVRSSMPPTRIISPSEKTLTSSTAMVVAPAAMGDASTLSPNSPNAPWVGVFVGMYDGLADGPALGEEDGAAVGATVLSQQP